MPIESHEDMFLYCDMEKDIGRIMRQIANQEKKLGNIRDRLAAESDNLARTKSEGIRKLKDIIKKIEDLDRDKSGASSVDRSKVNKGDIGMYEELMEEYESDIKQLNALSDALKSLAFQVANTFDKLVAYGEGFELIGSARKAFSRSDKVLFENKDKLMKPEKIGQLEDKKKEASRAFDQAKNDIGRRKDEYYKEYNKYKGLLNTAVDKMKV
ncbi:MAG: hypothetical protein ACFFCS_09100 [Candidatus Hodarchaeota archaeon]